MHVKVFRSKKKINFINKLQSFYIIRLIKTFQNYAHIKEIFLTFFIYKFSYN